jgi:hypothetical protein
MIECKKENDGNYTISGLSASDIEIIQEGILRLFAESRKETDRKFRHQVLVINQPIDEELEKLFADQALQRDLDFV